MWRRPDESSPPQTVRKVLARLKHSVPLFKARSGFSILTEECFTFQTVFPGPRKTMTLSRRNSAYFPRGRTNTKKALAKNASASSFVAGRRIELRTS